MFATEFNGADVTFKIYLKKVKKQWGAFLEKKSFDQVTIRITMYCAFSLEFVNL